MWRRPVLGALRSHGGVAATTSLVLSVVAVLPSRRGYFTREHRSAITLQDGRGSYAATLSWQWSTGQPRHLVLRVLPPDSTSSVARDSFESLGEEPSGTNSAAPQATGRDASDYVFGRLFLRPYNVAELLCVLEGRTAFAKITREHAALTLTPMESKTNNTTRSVATSPSQLPALSCFMLSGHFTIKAPVVSSASNDTHENLDKDDADDDDGGDVASPQETQYTYVTSDTRDMRLVLRDAELMFVKSHLENILSDFFGLEHRFHFEIAHEALQRQRARLEASYRRRAQGGGSIGGGGNGAVSGSAFSGRDRAAPVRYRSQQGYSSPCRPSAATTMRDADTTITNTVSHVPTTANVEEHAPRMTATAATTQAQTVPATAAAAAALSDDATTRATDKATTLREFSVDGKDIEEEEDIAEEEDEEVIEEEAGGAEEEEDVVAEMVQERDAAADALAASVATPLTAATASPIRASAQPAPPTTTQESELSADVDDVAEEFIEDEAEELAEVEEEDGEGVFEEPQTGSTASPLPTATTTTTTTAAHTASGAAAQTGANTTTTAEKVVSGVTQPATASTSATQDATVELEAEDEYIRARYHRADDVKQVVIESVEKEGGFDVVRKTELKEQPIAQPGAVLDTVVSSGAFRSKDGQVTGSFQYVAQQQQPTPTITAATAVSHVTQVAQPQVGTPVMKPATAAPSFISRVVVPTHAAKASSSSSTKKTAKTKRGGGGKRGKKAARGKKQ